MKRNPLALLLALVAGLLLSGCGKECETGPTAATAAAPQQTYHWKLVTTWPKNFPGLGAAPENFAKAVNEMSNGRLQIKVYGANELVPAMGVFDAVAGGAAEMGHGAAYYWKGKIPAAQFMTAVPFGMNAQEMNGWLHYGGGLDLWRKLYAKYDLVPFAGGSTGVQMAGWFKQEITSVADLQGLKMRIPGLAGEVFQRIGGVPVTLPGGDIFTAMQTGSIDATEWVGPYNDLTFGLHKVAKFYYYPGWQEPGAMLEFITNAAAWNSLPPDLQAIVTAAARAVNQDMLDEYTARNNTALKELVEKHGVQLKRLPDDVLAALRTASDQVIQEVIAADADAREIYESFSAFQRDVESYTRISEEAFLQTRQVP
jgi:TRAP-type mannitol/chloroaromatic compound transport system substrate-binding protein